MATSPTPKKPGRGGARPNTGGARPNSGPKTKEPEPFGGVDPLDFLLQVMRGEIDPSPSQLKAATAAAQYVHAKVGEGGKKDEKQRAADKAAGGKFSAASAPNVTPIKRAQG